MNITNEDNNLNTSNHELTDMLKMVTIYMFAEILHTRLDNWCTTEL